jgi:ADP-ribose pyrophosphatase YjhB (NUDIX family)
MTATFPRVGSALLVLDQNKKILLGKRNKDPQRGNWIIPGGKIRAFESISEAAERELLEETGLKVQVTHPFRVYEIINPPDEHRIVIYSWGKLVGGSARASDDLSELAFFAPGELADLQISPLVKRVLRDAGLFKPDFKAVRRMDQQLCLLFMPVLVSEIQNGSARLPKVRRTKRRKCAEEDNVRRLFDSSQ